MKQFAYGKWVKIEGTELTTHKRVMLLKGRYRPVNQCKDYFSIWLWAENFESPEFHSIKESEEWLLANKHLVE